MKIGICKLCLQKKDLLKNSHIIPDFMYHNLFDEKHRMIKTQGIDILSAQKIQTGEKESYILCKKCDNEILGLLEGYASRVLFTGKGKDAKIIKTQNQLHPDGILTSTYCENLDYLKFKLFLLSILWRASISKASFFNQVQLGPIEEFIRKMIFENKPLNQLDFPCMVLSFRHLQRHMTSKIISSPHKIRNAKGTRYLFQIGQLILLFFVSKNDIPQWVCDAAITPDNKMRIVHLDDKRGINLMEKLFDPIIIKSLHAAVMKSDSSN